MFPFKKKYKFQGLVQFDENKRPCICGIWAKWLETIEIKAYSEKDAQEIAFLMFKFKYPQYENYIQLD